MERIATAIAAAVDPGLAERRRESAQKLRARVTIFREQAGTAGLLGRDLPVDETLAAYANLDARAKQYKDCGAFPGERLDRLRAAAYLDILNGICAGDRIACGHLGSDAASGTGPEDAAGDQPQCSRRRRPGRRRGAGRAARAWAGPIARAMSATAAARRPTTAASPTTANRTTTALEAPAMTEVPAAPAREAAASRPPARRPRP